MLPRAQRICQEWEKAIAECQDLIAGKQPELCVAAIHSVCAYYLPPILRQFCRDYPETQLRVTALGSDRALKVLRDGLIDVAIIMNNRFLTASTEIEVQVLYEEEIEVLMSANHPLAERERVSFKDLADYPQAIFKDGYGMQRLVREWFTSQNLPLKPVMELNSLDAFRGVVRQGEIVALLPHRALIDSSKDPTLTVRQIARPKVVDTSTIVKNLWHNSLSRQVVMVTTSDRLEIPP